MGDEVKNVLVIGEEEKRNDRQVEGEKDAVLITMYIS
jgi:hypothetical protein